MRLAALAVLAPLLLVGCQSQYFADSQKQTDLVVTDLIVRTTPSGARIRVDDRELAASPLSMPIEYPHTVSVYRRQTNVGARLRESWGTVGTIIGFPIWLPASLFHATEERRLHEYGSNRFTVSAILSGYDEAWQEVELKGEDTFEVDFKLTPTGSLSE